MKRYVEIWQSDQNRQERHYFMKDENNHGYQNATYLLGLNPELVTPEQEAQILAILDASTSV